ncbi:MAG: hypothetical protein WDZ91_12265 [Paenibacillaceae bacterium]
MGGTTHFHQRNAERMAIYEGVQDGLELLTLRFLLNESESSASTK